jgi:hypothetical protein
MESMEDRTMKQSCLPPFPQPLETAKETAVTTSPPHDDEEGIKAGRLTLLLGRSRDKSTWQQQNCGRVLSDVLHLSNAELALRPGLPWLWSPALAGNQPVRHCARDKGVDALTG